MLLASLIADGVGQEPGIQVLCNQVPLWERPYVKSTLQRVPEQVSTVRVIEATRHKRGAESASVEGESVRTFQRRQCPVHWTWLVFGKSWCTGQLKRSHNSLSRRRAFNYFDFTNRKHTENHSKV